MYATEHRPAIVVTAAGGELLTLEQAKRHLRVLQPDLDVEIETLLGVAREYCERFTARTLRLETSRTIKLCEWWCNDYRLPFPPLLSVTSVAYYDTDNVTQTLNSTNYYVELSSDGDGRIVWKPTATIPNLYDRTDAITITYKAGYASADTCPKVALQAMRTKLTELFAVGSESELRAAAACTDRLLGLVDWTGYA
jgi:uncharacterized phiE125 gp8 family phage protein